MEVSLSCFTAVNGGREHSGPLLKRSSESTTETAIQSYAHNYTPQQSKGLQPNFSSDPSDKQAQDGPSVTGSSQDEIEYNNHMGLNHSPNKRNRMTSPDEFPYPTRNASRNALSRPDENYFGSDKLVSSMLSENPTIDSPAKTRSNLNTSMLDSSDALAEALQQDVPRWLVHHNAVVGTGYRSHK